MTLTEVIDAVTRHTCKYYLRPVHWRGSGTAYSLQDGFFYFVPSVTDRSLLPGPTTVEDPGYAWEMVDVATIRAERCLK